MFRQSYTEFEWLPSSGAGIRDWHRVERDQQPGAHRVIPRYRRIRRPGPCRHGLSPHDTTFLTGSELPGTSLSNKLDLFRRTAGTTPAQASFVFAHQFGAPRLIVEATQR